MGLMGRYIDQLPDAGKDRLIRAQDWCLAEVVGPQGSRCLVGHAEDWQPLAAADGAWRGWLGETGGPDAAPPLPAPAREVEVACSPFLFAFRRARPADLGVYRARIARWGLESECRIGARFDRLCTRRGHAEAVRLVKARASRAFAYGRAVLSAGSPAASRASASIRACRASISFCALSTPWRAGATPCSTGLGAGSWRAGSSPPQAASASRDRAAATVRDEVMDPMRES